MSMSVGELSDRCEIYDLYSRYVHAGDDHNFEMLDTVFVPDATFNYSDNEEVPSVYQGGQRDLFIKLGGETPYKHHHCSSILIEFDDEARTVAHVKSKMYFSYGSTDELGNLVFFEMHGVYADVLLNTDLGWRISSRKWNPASIVGPMPGTPGPREFGSVW